MSLWYMLVIEIYMNDMLYVSDQSFRNMMSSKTIWCVSSTQDGQSGE